MSLPTIPRRSLHPRTRWPVPDQPGVGASLILTVAGDRPRPRRSSKDGSPGSKLLANHAGLCREPALESRSPKTLNDQLREPPKTSGLPTKIPQVRLLGRPHRYPTDTTAFRSTSRYSC
jgi:hypothetical protein